MKKIISIFLLVFCFLNPIISFAAEGLNSENEPKDILSDEEKSRQEAAALSKEIDKEVQEADTEVEEIRIKAEEDVEKDVKQARTDLDKSIKEFQQEKFPADVEEEQPPEVQ